MKSIFRSTPRSRRARPQQHQEAKPDAQAAFFQPKLSVNAPGDQYEREADAVADQVVAQQGAAAPGLNGQAAVQRKPISTIQRIATPDEEKMPATNDGRMAEDKKIQEKPEVQRAEAPKEEEKTVQKMDAPKEEEKPVQKMDAPKEEEKPVQKMDAPKEEEKPVQKAAEEEEPVQAKSQSGASQAPPNFGARLSARKGQGEPLPAAARTHMEQGIGADFSQVRVHTDSEAVQMNKDIHAQAFTHGRDVYFNSGKFSPESTEGKRLLAHELTHVVQQGGGQQTPQMQKKDEKGVSPTAMNRIGMAWRAIKHTKNVFSFGAGNQKEALKATNFNSYYRLKVVRDKDKKFWQLTPEAKALANVEKEAFTAAKADIAQGGNCGEHATVAWDYLRVSEPGETINKASKQGLDHAFIIIGNVASETDDHLVVSDPWPTAPTATLWEDHFAHTTDRSKLKLKTMIADGQNHKEVIKAGLTLTEEGKKMLTKTDTPEETQKKIDAGLGDWIWNHPNAADPSKDFKYIAQSGQVQFETNTAKLTSASLPILDSIALFMDKYQNMKLRIVGHTDSVGDEKSNQILSEKRAKACCDYLIDKGIDAGRVTSLGFGELSPIADNKTKEGRSKNRRVEFTTTSE